MTNYEIIQQLLNGAYIMQRPNRRKGYGYALYKGKGIIIAAVSNTQFNIYKEEFKEKKGKFTLNLNLVRQQHGNWLTKQLYKEHRKKLSHDNAQNLNRCDLPEYRLQRFQHDERQPASQPK